MASERACVLASPVCISSASIAEAARAALEGARGKTTVTRGMIVGEESMRKVYGMLIERSITHAKANEDGLGITDEVDELLRGLLGAAQRACDRRFAAGTRRLDRATG